ncbi:SDR family oxidoreductase [Nitrososphaera viennensis]|nr:SDR family oxidoreductase [Nitrososphaera viennensis]
MARTAIVTGSGRGIGKATALLLAKKGVNIVVCSRTKSEVDSTVDEARKLFHDGVLGVVCDVGVASQVDALVKKAVARFGQIDILVNNAGIFYAKKLVDTSEKEWDDTMNSNLKSAFLCSKAVLPHLTKTGTIINVSSGAGKTGFENLSAYCASKFGMMGLAESLSWEVQGSIRVMAICPGEVDTRMQESDPVYYRENRSRMLKPEQVAEKIAEMIFDTRRYRNGQSVDI